LHGVIGLIAIGLLSIGAIRLAHGFGHGRQANRRRLEVARIDAKIFGKRDNASRVDGVLVESSGRRCRLVGNADLNHGVIWHALDRATAEDLDAAGSDRLRHGLATDCEAAGEGYKKISHER
jgi:hypothetical protein